MTGSHSIIHGAKDPSLVPDGNGTVGNHLDALDAAVDAVPVGDVVGPASATDNAIARFDGTTGKLIQDSGVTLEGGDFSRTGSIDIKGTNSASISGSSGSTQVIAFNGTVTVLGNMDLAAGDNLTMGGGDIDTEGGTILVGGGDIDTEDGDIDIGAGDLITAGGTGLTGSFLTSLNPGWQRYITVDGGVVLSAVNAFVAGAAKDTQITGAAPTTNYGSNTSLIFGDLAAGVIVYRGLMEFDFSAVLGAGLTLSSSYIRVYQSSPSGSFSANIYKCKRTFIEAQATWNDYATSTAWGTAGAANTTSDIDTTVSDPITVTTASGAFVEYTVTNNATNALSGAGIMRIRLSAANEAASNNVTWNTKENTGGAGYRVPLGVLIFTT